MATIVEALQVALGFKVDDTGLKQFRQQAQSVRSAVLELGGVIAGIAGSAFAVKKAIDISSEFESNRNAIAGFLSALSISSDFNAGLKDADATLQSITAAAAKLPGEANEYIEVFRAGLPFLQKAMPGAGLGDMTKFTNMITAVGRTAGVDAAQIGRDLALMLQGNTRNDVKTFQQLLPFLQQIPGQAHLSVEAFNAMSKAARVAVLQQALSLGGLRDMIDASANSFDAMWGALKSAATQIVRLGTEGLFKGLKDDLQQINSLFFDDDGKITETGRNVVELLRFAGSLLGALLKDVVSVVSWVARMTKETQAFKAVLVGIALLLGGVPLLLGIIIEDVYGFLTGAESVTGELVEQWAPALYVIIGLVGLLAAAMAPIPLAVAALSAGVLALSSHWQQVLDGVQDGLNKVIDLMNVVNRLFTDDEAHMNKHFSFATERRNNEWAQSTLGAGGGVLLPAQGPARPIGMTGADVAGGSYRPDGHGMTVQSTTHVGTVNINGNDDPKKVHDGWNRDVRDGQTKVGL